MEITATQRKMNASEIAPEKLAGNSQFTKQEKIAEASRQFEAVLLRQILENSQKTVIKSKFSDNSASSAIYRDQITAQMADSISKAGTFGFAKTFEQQLNRPASSGAAAAPQGGGDALVAGLRAHPWRQRENAPGASRSPRGDGAAPPPSFSAPNLTPHSRRPDSRGAVHPTFKNP